MAVNPSTLLAATALSNVANKGSETARDKIVDVVHGSTPEHGPIEFEMLVSMLANIEKAILEAREEVLPTLFKTKSIPANGQGSPFELKRGKYKHVSIGVTTAVSLIVQTDIGPMTFNFNKGFSPMDVPSGSRINVNGNSPATVIFCFSDESVNMSAV